MNQKPLIVVFNFLQVAAIDPTKESVKLICIVLCKILSET